ncbi:MAG: hypothetical protein LUE29_00755 [Lachnospiraceae bacterium]|nr:hypothetical protein [Lachnospiraceae bacterium]
MSENEVALIRQVDDAKLTADKHIETKYGLGTIRNLSSGCKTLLNIIKHPEKVVCVEECGPNVLEIIFSMDNIKIYMSRPTLVEISEDVKPLVGEFTQNEQWSVNGALMGACWYKDCCVSEHPDSLRCGKPETGNGNEKMRMLIESDEVQRTIADVLESETYQTTESNF